jgi:Uma2 family endonuclease
MSPAPRPRHQVISSNLNFELQRFVRERALGKVLNAPIDVILPRGLGTPVQPDILFIRRDNLGIIGETTIDGVPDLVVEILSPSNWIDDRRTKFDVYADAGVAEYWIIDPHKEEVEQFILRDNRYELVEKYGPGESVSSQAITGFSVAVDGIFAQ